MRDKIVQLIDKLIIKNFDEETVWAKTSLDSEFKIVFNKATITVNNWEDSDGENYEIKIYNSNGDKIEDIHSMESSGEKDILILKKLYDSVVENYFKVDKTIDNILEELDK